MYPLWVNSTAVWIHYEGGKIHASNIRYICCCCPPIPIREFLFTFSFFWLNNFRRLHICRVVCDMWEISTFYSIKTIYIYIYIYIYTVWLGASIDRKEYYEFIVTIIFSSVPVYIFKISWNKFNFIFGFPLYLNFNGIIWCS